MWSHKMLAIKTVKYLKYRLITSLCFCQSRLRYVITGPEMQQSKESSKSRYKLNVIFYEVCVCVSEFREGRCS